MPQSRRLWSSFYARASQKQARHQYTLAYVPAGTQLDSNYHRIDLQVSGDGLTAQTREGYYKDSPKPNFPKQ